MRSKLTDEEGIKIIFDEENDIIYEESDVDLTSDEEDGRDPAWVPSEVADTFFVHNVITQLSADVVSESDSNDEEPPPALKSIRTYSVRNQLLIYQPSQQIPVRWLGGTILRHQ
jgi:hypothetical protein